MYCSQYKSYSTPRKEDDRLKLEEMVLRLEDQIRSRENEIRDLEELIKEKDKKIKEAEENSNKYLIEEVQHTGNSQPFQKMMKRCLYNDRGHCKFGRECLFNHFSKVCPLRQECPYQGCQMRHPLWCTLLFWSKLTILSHC